MPSTFTPNLGFELQATGENTSTWGIKANNDFSLIETAIAGYVAVPMANANVTLSKANAATDQARNAILEFTGANTAIRTVTIPSVSKNYVVMNSTTGGFAINMKTASGSTLVIPAGAVRTVFCDGTDTMFADAVLPLTGGTVASLTVTGNETVGGALTITGATSGEAATFDHLTLNGTGAVAGATSLNTGPFSGLRNKLGNARFNMNQLGVTLSSTALAAGAPWIDFWKAGTGGCTVSGVLATGIATITAGTLVQVIDGDDCDTGTYVINWTGTATCSVNGVAKAKGDTVAVTKGTDVTVLFNTGTVSFPQFEPGPTPTAFEQRPYALEHLLCRWRFERVLCACVFYQGVASVNIVTAVPYTSPKRITPTITFGPQVASANMASINFTNVTQQGATLSGVGTSAGIATCVWIGYADIAARL